MLKWNFKFAPLAPLAPPRSDWPKLVRKPEINVDNLSNFPYSTVQKLESAMTNPRQDGGSEMSEMIQCVKCGLRRDYVFQCGSDLNSCKHEWPVSTPAEPTSRWICGDCDHEVHTHPLDDDECTCSWETHPPAEPVAGEGKRDPAIFGSPLDGGTHPPNAVYFSPAVAPEGEAKFPTNSYICYRCGDPRQLHDWDEKSRKFKCVRRATPPASQVSGAGMTARDQVWFAAADTLLTYIEAHGWGTIPEPWDSITPLYELMYERCPTCQNLDRRGDRSKRDHRRIPDFKCADPWHDRAAHVLAEKGHQK